ncbi:MAG: antitoxin [Candidatus Micrarchaeia archaeon]
MVSAQVYLDDYTNHVLNVIKAKFGLTDKSGAINKLAEIYGEDYVEKDANGEYVKKILDIEERHFKKYGNRKMSLKELDELCGES